MIVKFNKRIHSRYILSVYLHVAAVSTVNCSQNVSDISNQFMFTAFTKELSI